MTSSQTAPVGLERTSESTGVHVPRSSSQSNDTFTTTTTTTTAHIASNTRLVIWTTGGSVAPPRVRFSTSSEADEAVFEFDFRFSDATSPSSGVSYTDSTGWTSGRGSILDSSPGQIDYSPNSYTTGEDHNTNRRTYSQTQNYNTETEGHVDEEDEVFSTTTLPIDIQPNTSGITRTVTMRRPRQVDIAVEALTLGLNSHHIIICNAIFISN